MSDDLNNSAVANVANLRQRLLALIWVFLCTAVIFGQWGFSPIKSTSISLPSRINSGELITDSEPSENSDPRHGFRLEVHSNIEPRPKRSALLSESESVVNAITTELNDTIILPSDVEVSFEACGDSDVYYDDKSHKVVMCYEWITETERIVSRVLRRKAHVRETMEALVAAVVLHESAHALIQMLKLPVTGREEDDADQFSTLMLLHQHNGARKALEVARIYKIMSQVSRREPKAYWDEHSLDAQRYYDTLCMIYGKDPKGNAKLVRSQELPDERADLCEEDYGRIESSWKSLLRPYERLALVNALN